MRIIALTSIAALLALYCECRAIAQTQPGSLVASGLNTPWGIAAAGNNLYVSESGAGQVVVIDPAKPDKPTPLITGFETKPFREKYQLGPLGLAFVDKDTLLVGGGDLGLGADVVRQFGIPAALTKPLATQDAKAKLGPIPKGNPDETGDGMFFAVAANSTAAYVLGQGEAQQGWIFKAEFASDKKMLGELKPLTAARKPDDIKGAFALALAKAGFLVIGSAGEFGHPGDSTITFFHGRTGKLLMHLKLDLNDLVAVAYSPKTGRLYALDFSEGDAAHGGLYRIDSDSMNGAATVKIAPLDRPTAMAFNSDGILFVTILGGLTDAKDANAQPGQVVKFTGL